MTDKPDAGEVTPCPFCGAQPLVGLSASHSGFASCKGTADHYHGLVHMTLEQWERRALLSSSRRIEELEKALGACLEQAVGCAMNHYPGEPEYCEGEHIAAARAALSPSLNAERRPA